MNKRVSTMLTNMDQPLGTMVGNALEIKESIAILQGTGPSDSVELTVELGAEMLLLGKSASSREDARQQVRNVLANGKAFEKFMQMVRAQGGDERAVLDPSRLAAAHNKTDIVAQESGYVTSIDNRAIGFAICLLGGGRLMLGDQFDFGVGLEIHAKIGDKIDQGQPLCTMHYNVKGAEEAKARVLAAFAIAPYAVDRTTLIKEVISAGIAQEK